MGVNFCRRDFAIVLEHFTSAGSDCSAQVVAVAEMPVLLQMFPDVRHGASMCPIELRSEIANLKE
jgi:hypothetical protein